MTPQLGRSIYASSPSRPSSAPCQRITEAPYTPASSHIATLKLDATLRCARPCSAPALGRSASTPAMDWGSVTPPAAGGRPLDRGSFTPPASGSRPHSAGGSSLGNRGRPASAGSLGRSNSNPFLSRDEPHVDAIFRMPRCYSSHTALAEAYSKNPKLFQKERNVENWWQAEQRHTGINALAYQRRQLLLPEMEYIHRSKLSDGWRRHQQSRELNFPGNKMKDAGAPSEIIHKDCR